MNNISILLFLVVHTLAFSELSLIWFSVGEPFYPEVITVNLVLKNLTLFSGIYRTLANVILNGKPVWKHHINTLHFYYNGKLFFSFLYFSKS